MTNIDVKIIKLGFKPRELKVAPFVAHALRALLADIARTL